MPVISLNYSVLSSRIYYLVRVAALPFPFPITALRLALKVRLFGGMADLGIPGYFPPLDKTGSSTDRVVLLLPRLNPKTPLTTPFTGGPFYTLFTGSAALYLSLHVRY